MVDFTKVPLPPPPRIVVKPAMNPREIADALHQIDMWTRSARHFMEVLRDSVIELQNP